jgi:phosphatidylinositol kinase/protein kinase (PI-3  family)
MRVADGIPLGCSLLLPVGTVNSARTLKVLLHKICTHSPELVEQAQLVSTELIRVAILWREMWYGALPSLAANTP